MLFNTLLAGLSGVKTEHISLAVTCELYFLKLRIKEKGWEGQHRESNSSVCSGPMQTDQHKGFG